MADSRAIAVKYLTAAALVIVFLIAGAVRIEATDMRRKVVTGDETTYLFAAKSLLKYHTLTRDVDGAMYHGEKALEPTARLSPGYPLFVASILATGGNVFAIYVTNIVFSLVSMFLMLWIMLELRLGRVPILVAIALAAIYPGFVYNLNRVLTEQLYMVLFLSFAATYIRAVRANNTKWMAAAGCLLAAAVHVRAEGDVGGVAEQVAHVFDVGGQVGEGGAAGLVLGRGEEELVVEVDADDAAALGEGLDHVVGELAVGGDEGAAVGMRGHDRAAGELEELPEGFLGEV